MTLNLQVKFIDDAFDEASQRLNEAGGARHIAIDTKLHRIEFKKKDARDTSLVIIQTDEMFTADQIVDLVTLSVSKDSAQRAKAREKFIEFITTCNARSIVWMCPLLT